jgi:hypothetical protein
MSAVNEFWMIIPVSKRATSDFNPVKSHRQKTMDTLMRILMDEKCMRNNREICGIV